MSSKLALRFLCLQLCCSIADAAACVTGGYITQEDCDTQKLADANTAKLCTGKVSSQQEEVKKTIDKRRDALWSALGTSRGDNLFVNMLKETSGPDGVATSFQTTFFRINYILQRTWPFILIIVLAVFWIFMCWTPCPCCRCCRCTKCCTACGKKDQHKWEYLSGKVGKAVTLVVIAALGLALMVVAFLGLRGHNDIVAGFDQVSCTSSQLLNTTLAGSADPKFLGMFPLLEEFGTMSTLLEPQSTFMQTVKSVIDETKSITDAVNAASTVLTGISDETKKVDSVVAAEGFKCHYCATLTSSLDATTTQLDNSIGKALSGAREQVDSQLQNTGGEKLKGTLDTAASPLNLAKNMTRDALKLFSGDDDGIPKMIQGHLTGAPAKGGVFGIIALALLLWFCSCGDILFKFTCKEDSPESGPSCCPVVGACCSFCCGFPVAILAFLVGGLFMMLSIPAAGVCLVMDELSSSTLIDLTRVMGSNMDPSQADNMFGIIDSCFIQSNTTDTNPNLLDVIKDANGTSMRVSVVQKVKDQIDSSFNQTMSASSGDMATNTEIKKLVDLFTTMPIAALVRPSTELINADYSNIKADLADGPGLNCDDAIYEGKTIKGVKTWTDAFAAGAAAATALTVPTATMLCERTLQCLNGQAKYTECQEAKALIDKIQAVQTLNTYQCDSSTCKFIASTGTSYDTHFDGRGTKVQTAFANIDTEVKSSQDKITVSLKTAVKKNIMDPIEKIADGATCGFLAVGYRNFLSGLCFQGVYGLSEIGKAYVASGVLATVILFFMYWFWRYVQDNYSSHHDAADGSADTKGDA